MLYLVQELTARLGVFTGRGHAELIRERYGLGWALVAVAGLAVAAIGSLVTEFTGVAGIGESSAFRAPDAADGGRAPYSRLSSPAPIGGSSARRW